ncbi:MAG: plasmid pRiA4b ORF-3 family protein [Burkholderiales bacterium]|nr:plasmid pRiA4b ORF-3 family protein [Burkholderiales bacterium]
MKRLKQKKPATATRPRAKKVYTFEIALLSGPVTRDFARKNRTISRTIEAQGGRTLADLHDAIFDAFDRYEEHLYEFQFGGKRPMDPEARRYGPPAAMFDPFGENDGSADAERTTLDSLGLAIGDVFGYWFDFGDDWWHQVRVIAIAEGAQRTGPLRVTHRVGDSPPQYAEPDE